MTFQLRSDVIDIRSSRDSPEGGDAFLVDTCVWKTLTYTRAAKPQQVRHYPPYIKAVRSAGGTLYASGFAYAELAKLIEIEELKVYQARHSLRDFRVKEFRSLSSERTEVVEGIATSWNLLQQMATRLSSALNDAAINAALAGLQAADFLDGHDAIQLAEARRNGVTKILSDDSDFASIPGIQLFTANEWVIREASAARRLVKR